MNGCSFEPLSETVSVCVSPEHRFGSDAFLLADFAHARRRDVVCDLGTGCGIIPLLLARRDPPERIYAVEIQQQAVRQLSASLAASRLEERIIPIHADLRTLKTPAAESCDLVTCNPPYQAAGRGFVSEEPAARIARHEMLCTLEDVCRAAARLLKTGGRLCLCQRPERLCDAMASLRAARLEPKRLRFVSKTPQDAPWLFLIEGRKGGRPGLAVEPVLAVYEGERFSAEMEAVYGWDPAPKKGCE